MTKIFTFLCIATTLLISTNPAGAGGSDNCRLVGEQDAQGSEADRLVVHEWGTFTTFSGSDGVYLDFQPLAAEQSDLPDFVLNRAYRSERRLFSKSKVRGRVRMETPVTYFYTDRIREVNVRVAFPKGLLTEFYPPVREMLPPFDASVAYKEGEPLGNSSLDWGKVTLIPISQLAPTIEDPVLRDQVSRHLAESAVPRGGNDHHYAQARATDSALVHVRASDRPKANPWSTDKGGFMEKFLFYRGVGRFELPLTAIFDAAGGLTLRNDAQFPINSAILIDVQGDKIRATEVGPIQTNSTSAFGPTDELSLEELSQWVQRVLVSQGLYPKEAASMVETWKQSWFAEAGTRVLYIVPPPMTDELLPLTVEPVPDETLRVLVGRMEIMAPQTEQRLIEAVRDSSQARQRYLKSKNEKAERGPFPVSDRIRSLGRMTEPALVRISKIAGEQAVRTEAEWLIAQIRSE